MMTEKEFTVREKTTEAQVGGGFVWLYKDFIDKNGCAVMVCYSDINNDVFVLKDVDHKLKYKYLNSDAYEEYDNGFEYDDCYVILIDGYSDKHQWSVTRLAYTMFDTDTMKEIIKWYIDLA